MNRKKITLRDVAQKCGTSVPTASYVLSGSTRRYVNQELRERILSCASELGYVHKERRKTAADFPTLAVVLPQTENVFFSRLSRGLQDIAANRGYQLAIYYTDDLAEREIRIIEHLFSAGYEGLVLVPSVQSCITAEHLERLQRPYVVAERPLPCENHADFFAMDNYLSGYEATQALIRAGHQRIGLITWNNRAQTLLDRHVGYARALEEANLPYHPEFIRSGGFSEQDGYRMTRELLREHSDLTALFYAYHLLAEGGLLCLREQNVRVPEDLSIVISGDPVWVNLCTPTFAHMTLPSYEVGAHAATALIDRIEKQPDQSAQHMTIPGRFVSGESIMHISNG